MDKSECFELGLVSKTYSFKGEVILFLDCDDPTHYYGIDAVFLEINKQLVPFFIENSSISKKNQLRVRFEGVDDEAAAKRIVKKKAFLPVTALPKLEDDQFYYHEIEGYTVFDKETGEVGVLETVVDNPGNTLLQIDYNGNEALIPLNDRTLIKVDKEAQEIHLDIPEGLLDVYGDNGDF